MKEQDIDEMPLKWPGGPVVRVGDRLYSSSDAKPYPMIIRRLFLDQHGAYAMSLSREDKSGWRTESGHGWHTSIELWCRGRIARLRDEQNKLQREIDKLLLVPAPVQT